MEIEELIIDNEPIQSPPEKTTKAQVYFAKGEWKKGLAHSIKLFSSPTTPFPTLIEIYKAACELACKIIEASNIKLGIQITKKLSKFLPFDKIEHFIQYQCEVLNYVTCAYKQVGKLYLAKKYIDKAMLIIQDFTQVSWDKSNTFLNMCAVLSAMGKHSEALTYAKNAIDLAKEEMVEVTLNKDSEKVKKKVAVLAIAYNNYAVEAEFLGNLHESVQFYQKAYEFLSKHDPENVEMIQKFKENFLTVKKNLAPRSRPSSAKSAVSQKSTKSLMQNKNFSKPKLKKNLKIVASEKNFLDFKNQCQEFLSGKNEWFKRNLTANQGKIVKREGFNVKPPLRPEFKPSQAEVITAPVKGVENVRKAVVHQVFPGVQEVKPAKKEEIQVEKKELKLKKNPSKNSSVSFSEQFDTTPLIVQDFEEVTKNLPRITEKESISVINTEPNPNKQENVQINNSNFIQIVCKIQARFRGMLVREKIKLLKSKPEILYRGAKKINNTRCFITILKRNQRTIVIINDGNEDQTILAPEGLSAEEAFKRIDKNDKGFYFKKSENKEKPDLLKSSKVRMEDDDYDVKYYYDLITKTLFIKATRYSNSRVFSTEKKNLAFNSKPLIIRYINDEIEPNLCIKDQKLMINKDKVVFERELLAKGTRIIHKKNVYFTVNKVAIEDGFSVEVLAECFTVNLNCIQVFTMNEIIESLELFNVTDLSQDPHSTLLPLHVQENKIVLRKLDKNWLKCIYSEKEFFNSNEYLVKVYKVHDDACTIFFQLYNKNCPLVESYSITEKDLSETFQIPLKKLKKSIKRIVKSIVLKNNRIQFNTILLKSDTLLAKEVMTIVKIQSLFRGHLLRDKLNFIANKSPLIFSLHRTIEENEIILNFYKISSSLFIECLFEDLQKSYYLLIKKPELFFHKYSRLYDVKCIGNSILFNIDSFILPTLRGSLKFTPCSFLSSDELLRSKEWPMIKWNLNAINEYILLVRKLKDDSVLVKALKLFTEPSCEFKVFSKEEIMSGQKKYSPEEFANQVDLVNGEIIDNSQKKAKTNRSESIGEKVMYRTIVRLDSKLYQVVLSTDKAENMSFMFKQGSESHSDQKIEIPISKACELTGFNKSYLIPMADFILKKMLVIENDQIKLTEPAEKFDMTKALTMIQAVVRGYLQRGRLKKRVNFQLILKSTIKFNHQQFKALVYFAVEDYSICLINKPLILSAKLNKKMVKDHYDRLEKIFISKVLPKIKIKEKNGVQCIGGLKEWKKGSIMYLQVLESSRIGSNVSPRSVLSSRQSEPSVKVLKWRSPRTISDKKCIISIFDIGEAGLIEIFIISTDQTLTLEVSPQLIKDPGLLASQLEIRDNKIVMKSDSLNIILTDKRYISNKLAEVTIFLNESGYFATAFLPEEKKSLNAFLGVNVKPENIIKDLKIKEVMGQDVLIIS